MGAQQALTTDMENPCPLRITAGSMQDKFVVVKEGFRALGPKDHEGHVFQICEARQRALTDN